MSLCSSVSEARLEALEMDNYTGSIGTSLKNNEELDEDSSFSQSDFSEDDDFDKTSRKKKSRKKVEKRKKTRGKGKGLNQLSTTSSRKRNKNFLQLISESQSYWKSK